MLEVKAVDWGSNRWGQVALDDVARLGRVDNLKFFLVGFRNRLFIFDFSRSGTAGLELDTREFLSDWREFLVEAESITESSLSMIFASWLHGLAQGDTSGLGEAEEHLRAIGFLEAIHGGQVEIL